jgi:uncharacterized membrane protein YhaH (DUF805 family)
MNDMALLRKRWNDPLLTALTVLLVVMMFVIGPLQASGILVFEAFELVLALVLVAGVFVMSGKPNGVRGDARLAADGHGRGDISRQGAIGS